MKEEYGLIIDPDPTLKNNLMAFGFECDPGWYSLIKECLERIDTQLRKEKASSALLQVKEKFGGLRVYLSSCSEDVDRIVREYEILASHVCEVCGEFYTTKLREKNRWFKTLCDKCAKDLGYELYSE